MKRLQAASHQNHERWLVSYADFITLLFAFFVVMFASTQADHAKARAVSESVKEALEHGQFSTAISTVLGRGRHEARNAPILPSEAKARENPILPPSPGPPKPPADLTKSLGTLQQGLDAEIKAGKVQLKMTPRGLIVSLREAAFFASGNDAIYPGTYPSIEKIAHAIAALPSPVRLEGHTDSLPIHNDRFRNNWELSAARSIAMLELLVTRFNIPPERLAVAGYAETVPVESNDSEEGRAHNRRVDIVILNDYGLSPEPNGTAAAASPPAAKPAVQPPKS